MDKKRLLKLANYLDNVVDKRHFDLSFWSDFLANEHLIKKKKKFYKLNECGTVGCACGYATNIFPELKLNEYGGIINTRTKTRDFEAAADCFGISYFESMTLFSTLYYTLPQHRKNITPKDVAKKIRKFVELN